MLVILKVWCEIQLISLCHGIDLHRSYISAQISSSIIDTCIKKVMSNNNIRGLVIMTDHDNIALVMS